MFGQNDSDWLVYRKVVRDVMRTSMTSPEVRLRT